MNRSMWVSWSDSTPVGDIGPTRGQNGQTTSPIHETPVEPSFLDSLGPCLTR